MARADGRKCSSGKLSGHDGHDIKVVAACCYERCTVFFRMSLSATMIKFLISIFLHFHTQ